MTDHATTATSRQSVGVPLPPVRAFELFVDRFDSWWPKETHAMDEAKSVLLEAKEDGRWGEFNANGEFCPWGRVLAVERPARILLAWQLDPEFKFDPDTGLQTEVEITFEPEGDGTRVTLEHRGFEVWGERGAAMRDSVGSDGGWPQLLDAYAGLAMR